MGWFAFYFWGPITGIRYIHRTRIDWRDRLNERAAPTTAIASTAATLATARTHAAHILAAPACIRAEPLAVVDGIELFSAVGGLTSARFHAANHTCYG